MRVLAGVAGLTLAAGMGLPALAQQQAGISTDLWAQSPTPLHSAADIPRTPAGHPDLQGAVWAVNFVPVFETSPLSGSLVVPEKEATTIVAAMLAGISKSSFYEIDPEAHILFGESDGLPIVRGERRTRLIVHPADGKLPLTEAGRAEISGFMGLDPPDKDGPEPRPLGERCLAQQPPPVAMLISYNRMRLIQTADHVVMHSEAGDEVRIIPLADAPRSGPAPNPLGVSVLGDSSARWEGDTLVIDTINLPAAARIRPIPTIVVAPGARVIERLTLLSTDELLYQFTVEDPDIYAAPWLAEFSFHAAGTPMFPSPCHEHNYSLPNILKAARVAEHASK